MMPVPFSRAQQKREQQDMTPQRIVYLACREDGFRVSWRYRDDWLAERCAKLRKQGFLRMERGRGDTLYFATEAGRDWLKAQGGRS